MIHKRLSALFWGIITVGFLIFLCITTVLSLKLPNIKHPIQGVDTWSSIKLNLKHKEAKPNQNAIVVDEFVSIPNKVPDQGERLRQHGAKDTNKHIKSDFYVAGDEAQRMHTATNSSCPIQKESVPKTDLQMLSMYAKLNFDDIDDELWRQGWNISYKESQWNQNNKLKVFIVPHTHNNLGWIKYSGNGYRSNAVFNNMVEKMRDKPDLRFIWAETNYLSLWWNNVTNNKYKTLVQGFLNSGQLEIVTGGWVMNDEANAHWLSIIRQLTIGHQWLLDNLGYIPKNAWTVDPFGHSTSQSHILKLAGIENSVIQRVHYRVKKELAFNKQLEFKWRQLWDGAGETDIFTHVLPFYSFDIPHSCGPDPKICCQFDFKRLYANSEQLTCPWGEDPQEITKENLHERTSLILDQWRKKAQLFKSNMLLFPLGDYFRYDQPDEWDHQYNNNKMLIDYINNYKAWNTQVQFGTLQDYFTAERSEIEMSNFPVLSGDFFTYADRKHHYWSGYFTSRPFYKNMDRVLLAYVRAAELITTQATVAGVVSRPLSLVMRYRVDQARHTLALFQHHDGISGTSRDEIRIHFAKRMFAAIQHSQSAIQQAAYYLLKQPHILDQAQEDIYLDVDDIWRSYDEVPSKITITLDSVSPTRRIVLYNALSFKRHETLTVVVSTPHVGVTDSEGAPITAQVSPTITGDKQLDIAIDSYQLSFPVHVGPLGIAVYTVTLLDNASTVQYTSYAHVRVYNIDRLTVKLPNMFPLEQHQGRFAEDIWLQAMNGTGVVTNELGLVKEIISPDGTTSSVLMGFVWYGTKQNYDSRSGAYVFFPSGSARTLMLYPFPEIVVVEGIYKSTLYTALSAPGQVNIITEITVYNNPSLPHSEVEIRNLLLIDSEVTNLELAMRFSTDINNGDVFYTDANGMQMIQRRYFNKLPIEANYYPLPAAAYIEDGDSRFTLLTSTPLGMTAAETGQMEVMQDRRLSRIDYRGIRQGVVDNIYTRLTFKLIMEDANKPCMSNTRHPSGKLSLGAHVAQQMLLQPLTVMQYTPRKDAAPDAGYQMAKANAADIVMASCHSHVKAKNKDGSVMAGIGLTLHRVHLDSCYGHKDVAKWYPNTGGKIKISDIIEVPSDKVFNSTLTFVSVQNKIPGGVITLCPMEIRSVFVNHDY